MPDTRKHRGPHPSDPDLFADRHRPILREAVADLSWLLTRSYTPTASLKLVGDRFQLTERQRLAVVRSSCSDQSLARRLDSACEVSDLAGADLAIDGFNLLTSIEAALAGGVILHGRDGCFRDLASMHGNYRKVEETRPALQLIGDWLAEHSLNSCVWFFDKPVSNSGRIGTITRETAEQNGWNWRFELPADPDAVLVESTAVVVSADSEVLNGCTRWFNLAAAVIRERIPDAWIIDCRPAAL